MIKSLGRIYRHVQTVSGATILGNGTVALILDPHRLVQECIHTVGLRTRGHPPLPKEADSSSSGPETYR
jgi:chemotaxis protein histidine kinase CheA